MKKRNIIFAALTALVIFVAAIRPVADPAVKDALTVQTMMRVLNELHFQPQQLDNDFSEKVYKLYIDRLDIGRRFLTQQDVAQLEPYKLELDDAINAGTFNMFDLSVKYYDRGVLKAEGFFNDLIEKPIDLNVKEEIEGTEEKPFAANDAALKENWRKMLKFTILDKYYNKMAAKEKAVSGEVAEKEEDELDEEGNLVVKGGDAIPKIDSSLLTKTPADFMAEAQAETKKEYLNWFKRLHKQKRNDRLSIYLNVIANILDPHTEYYEPVEKENFDIGMSGRLEGIGARLQTTPDGESTKVSDVVVGGPAWKQKELEADDVIVKVAQDGQEAIDITGMEINEVVQQIRGPKGTKVTLTVRKKADASMKAITIIRDEVIMDEGYAKSLILGNKKDSDKIGYIKLPKFYADFDKADGRQCAIDVEKEVHKLKGQNVKGIILDLRNNGGGSLRDVVRMSGLFIERGPIVQVKDRSDAPQVLSDNDSRVQYNGPLIIMVNEYSASASEIMAAAMQDYGRAIIVGTNTFGKGTVQRFFDLDAAVQGNQDAKPLGSIKLTIQKFFRINGGSTQLEGVKPDIIMADSYYYLPTGEKEADYPMPWTKIDAAPYKQEVYVVDNIGRYKEKSATRMKANESFKTVLANAKRIKETRNRNTPLGYDDYTSLKKQDQTWQKQFKNAYKVIGDVSVENIPEDVAPYTSDEGKKTRNETWLKDVKKDFYIYETMSIMQDLIKNHN